jgi:uncharacterized pyridoxal phosphate-containing UPF0001 family protein
MRELMLPSLAMTITNNIKSNLESVQERISQACRRVGRSQNEVRLIAVTKTVEPKSSKLPLTWVSALGNRVQKLKIK